MSDCQLCCCQHQKRLASQRIPRRKPMKVDRNGQIGGQPLKLVRDLLRRQHDGYISVEDIVEHLQRDWWHEFIEDLFARGVIDREDRNYGRAHFNQRREKIFGAQMPNVPDFSSPAQTLFDYLLAEGYIEPKGSDHHRTTIKGQALRMTRLTPRVNRAKAEALLKGVLERVAAINADHELMHWVTEVRVFGSYLTDSDDLGDLDIALSYQLRPTGDEKDFLDAIRAFAAKHDKLHLSFEDRLDLPEQMVKQRIKGRSPYISMHGISELERNPGFGGMTVYTFTPPTSDE